MSKAMIPANTTTFKIEVQRLGGTKSYEFVGKQGEIFYDPVNGDLRISDDSTIGGIPLLQKMSQASANNTTTNANGDVIPLPGANTVPYGNTQVEAQGILNYGNVKSGFQTTDHFGWIKLDGRAVSLLTATQQAIAAQFGWTSNLPDATGRVTKMSGEAVGTTGGSDTYNIQQTNLPKVDLFGTTNIPQYTRVDVVAAINMDNPDVFGNVDGQINSLTTTPLNPGTFTPFTVVNKYLAINTFVFLGL